VKNYFLKATLIGIGLTLITGCASKTQSVKNSKIGDSKLTVKFESTKDKQGFTEITNKNVRGFSLNTLEPVSFDTKFIELGRDYVTFSDKFKEPENKYTKIDCQTANTRDIVSSVILFPTLLRGGICRKAQYFDYEKFDSDAKDWIEDNKINRDSLLTKYDQLIDSKSKNEEFINELANVKYSEMVSKYYQDAKNLKSTIFSQSNLSPTYVNSMRSKISYQSFIDNIFPCKTDCIKRIDSAMESMQSLFSKDKMKYETSDIELVEIGKKIENHLGQYKADLEQAKKLEEIRLAKIAEDKANKLEQQRQQKIKEDANKKAFEEQMKKIGE
jgi:hypothetical protein